ncbi:hypothetical protein [Thiocapsa bogorovii]|uniref:hypothetical protein n=1 Tax=Thiocapsa bogorovii TaxID=521689 RepID=UPI001E559098|nr:hypothetical protein [Thiocapsa bogorovii]UHD15464.1 hypothetical protein LT988_19675 [Thiocapsa bogorovii]
MNLQQHHIGTIVVGSVILTSLAVVVASIPVFIKHDWSAAMLTWTGIALLLVVAIPAFRSSPYEAFQPLTFILLSVMIGVTLKIPLVFLSQDDELLYHLLLGYSPDILFRGLFVMIIGLSMLTIGYLIRIKPIATTRLRFFSSQISGNTWFLLIGLLILTVSVFAIIEFVKNFDFSLADADVAELSAKRFQTVEGGEYRTAYGYLRWAVSLTPLLFTIAYAFYLQSVNISKQIFAVVAFLAAMVTVGFAVFTSSRSEVADLAIMAIILIYYLKKSVPLKQVITYLLLAFLILSLITVLRSTRSIESIESLSLSESLITMTVGGRHFIDLGKTSLIIESVPDRIPYQYGTTMVSWIVAPIPRVLWPDKPALGGGKLVGKEIYGLEEAGVSYARFWCMSGD